MSGMTILLTLLNMLAIDQAGTPKVWRSVVYSDGDRASGEGFLKVNAFLLSKAHTRNFQLLGVCRFDRGAGKWNQERWRVADHPTRLEPHKQTVYSRATDQILVRFPRDAGLYFAKWREDNHETGSLVMTGTGSCNDIDLGAQPNGFVAACVPLPNGGGKAMFVPDPQTQC
jgi:hypothetical protein